MENYRKFRAARVWSNKQLKQYAHIFKGSIVNVSAWKDKDKEGGSYHDYFLNAESYSITNYGGASGESEGELPYDEYELDLTQPLPSTLYKRFTTVFNHTTLEHVYDNRLAFKNLCDMACEAVIVVVPWLQEVHISPGAYDDYWRYSPYAMKRFFEENGFSMVVCNYNNDFDTAVYLFCIGIRNEVINRYPMFRKIDIDDSNPAGSWLGCDKKV